ncbi:hypothetical protein LUQ84_003320 [Hamiltosporidium tvaerminnensis]|nr:hypothetical protein LUQ84_003320 [Hamiltosporidium tvaerminnensis]
MLLFIKKLRTYFPVFNLLFMFLLKGNLYTVDDLNEKLTESLKEIYEWKEKTMRRFSNSDFYDIKLEKPILSPEMNHLVCNYINSSASRNFNIFLEYICCKQRARSIPDNIYFFTLNKLENNDFMFGIKYKNKENKTGTIKEKHIFLKNKAIRILLGFLFNLSLVFRKYYPDSIRTTGFYYKYSYANYRFMIFDSEFCFKNIVDLPNKSLMGHASLLLGRFKPVLSTKIKLSGKLPGFQPINDLDANLKKSFNLFSTLKANYKIKAAWRFENGFVEGEYERQCNLKTFVTEKIQELFNEKNILNTELLSIQEYSSKCKFSTDGLIGSPGYRREIKIHLSWQRLPYSVQFFLKESNENTRKYGLICSFTSNDAVEFEILSDKDLIITKIVKITKERFVFRDLLASYEYEETIGKYMKEIMASL